MPCTKNVTPPLPTLLFCTLALTASECAGLSPAVLAMLCARIQAKGLLCRLWETVRKSLPLPPACHVSPAPAPSGCGVHHKEPIALYSSGAKENARKCIRSQVEFCTFLHFLSLQIPLCQWIFLKLTLKVGFLSWTLVGFSLLFFQWSLK